MTIYNHDTGMEPCDEDIFIDDSQRDPGFYYFGRKIAATENDLKGWMQYEEYWPNVWRISDHGNVSLYQFANPDEIQWLIRRTTEWSSVVVAPDLASAYEIAEVTPDDEWDRADSNLEYDEDYVDD